jgi:hypothetical protein
MTIMGTIIDTLGGVIVAALLVWLVAGWLLRLAAISCSIGAAGLLAIGDELSALGVAGCGCVCWLTAQLLERARHGRWRAPRRARLLSGPTASRACGCRPTGRLPRGDRRRRRLLRAPSRYVRETKRA